MNATMAWVAVAGLLVGGVEPADDGGSLTQARWQFRPGDKWRAVAGSKGKDKILEASVTFESDKWMEVSWRVARGHGCRTCYYRLDGATGQADIKAPAGRVGVRGTFRMVGSRLELELSVPAWFGRPHQPSETLFLILERAED